MAEIETKDSGHTILTPEDDTAPVFHEPTEAEKKLLAFVVEHTDKWREYRDQNFLDDWLKYERVFRGQWASEDKARQSERSRIISPATQQAIETRHAEIIEAIFGQGECLADDIAAPSGADWRFVGREGGCCFHVEAECGDRCIQSF